MQLKKCLSELCTLKVDNAVLGLLFIVNYLWQISMRNNTFAKVSVLFTGQINNLNLICHYKVHKIIIIVKNALQKIIYQYLFFNFKSQIFIY